MNVFAAWVYRRIIARELSGMLHKWKMKQPKRIIGTLQACDEAASLLKRAGFEVADVSMRSEALYFRFPGRPGVLRVASHQGGEGMVGLDRVLARLTFSPYKLCKEPDTLVLTEDKLHGLVCAAIGRYMVLSNGQIKPTYDGPRVACCTTS